jgi:hypothetical protein
MATRRIRPGCRNLGVSRVPHLTNPSTFMKSAVRFGCVLVTLILAAFTTTDAAARPTHIVKITPSSNQYFAAGGRITFAVTLNYAEEGLGGLGIQLVAPAGWRFVSATGGVHNPDVVPAENQIGNLPFAYVRVPPSPVSFLFTVSYPAGLTGNQVFTGIQVNFTDEATGHAVVEKEPNIAINPAPTAMLLPGRTERVRTQDRFALVARRPRFAAIPPARS